MACEALGSNLAMLDSAAEQQNIGWRNRTWIGLHRDSSNNSRWQWIDGSLAVYLNFNQSDNSKVTEDCVAVYPSTKWNDLNCKNSLHYSCELCSGRSRYVRTTRNESFIFKETYLKCFVAIFIFLKRKVIMV